MLLERKVVVVTGAATPRGIGFATATRFAREGARIAILDLDGKAAADAAARLGAAHVGLACNVTDPAQCARAVDAVLAHFGALDIVVNNAGVSQPTRLMDVDRANYDLVMDASLRGTFNMSQAIVPYFREQHAGVIVCIGSLAALRGGGVFGGPHYAAAKGGVHSLAKSMARELAADGIRVNAIAPGLVDTDIFQGQLTPERRRAVEEAVPMGRLARAEEIADACLFLASDLSSYVTGAVLDVNGGLHMH
ncbi:SDR family NAD(P)-dependent oxidoreductase [Roseixanthobacter glucoisosaccharinicivorans]|uniref:SDR family NAD(P)-dependent oxidoreductase n=1 Tax=Roseixanthobacter glucoisosaccharinicivorans TaxID=3119923 RepID=UPI00372BAE91